MDPVCISSIPGTGYLFQKFVFLIYPVMSKAVISYNMVTSRPLLINSDIPVIPFLILELEDFAFNNIPKVLLEILRECVLFGSLSPNHYLST